MTGFERLAPALPRFTVNGVVDILVVAVLVYEALMVVRGTRAGHILVGILIMVSIYAAAVWFGLEALRSLLSFIVPYLGIAIIVLFQSEIRRTLARIGLSGKMAHDDLVCPPSVSACDHPARRLAVSPFHAQLSRRRGSAR